MKSAVEPDARQSRIILVTLLTKRCHGDSGYSCCRTHHRWHRVAEDHQPGSAVTLCREDFEGHRQLQSLQALLWVIQATRASFVNGTSLRMHPSHTLLVTVYTAPAQSLSAAEPPRKAPGCEGRHNHQFGWNLVLKTKSETNAFFGRGQRYRRLAVQHRVGSCCFPDATGRTFSVLSGMDKTSRSASVRVDRWHTGGALALNQAVPQCHRRPRSGSHRNPFQSLAEIFCRALLLLLG